MLKPVIISFSEDTFDKGDVLLGSIFLAHSLLGLPGIPFTSSFETGHNAWLISRVVTFLGLFEKTIDLFLLLVTECWFGISNLLGIGFEFLNETILNIKSFDLPPYCYR